MKYLKSLVFVILFFHPVFSYSYGIMESNLFAKFNKPNKTVTYELVSLQCGPFAPGNFWLFYESEENNKTYHAFIKSHDGSTKEIICNLEDMIVYGKDGVPRVSIITESERHNKYVFIVPGGTFIPPYSTIAGIWR